METILIVDDDPVNLSIGKGLFSSKMHVLTARSGLQALGYLKRDNLPDLMLVENNMPGMDGITLIKQLKEQRETATIPVILSAYLPNSNLIDEGLRAGAVEFIVKPASPMQIQRRVDLLLQVSTLKRENDALWAHMKRLEREGSVE